MSDFNPQEMMNVYLEKLCEEMGSEFVTPQIYAIVLQTMKYLNIKPTTDDLDEIDELRKRLAKSKAVSRSAMVTAAEQAELDSARGLIN